MTGCGSDAALGLTAILAAGGKSFAQTPAEAEFSQMPSSAIAGNATTVVMDIDEMHVDEWLQLAGNLAQVSSHPDDHRVGERLPQNTGSILAVAVGETQVEQHDIGWLHVDLVAITAGDARQLPFASIFDQHATKRVTAARLYQLIDAARDAIKIA